MHNKSNYPEGIGVTSISRAILRELLVWETIESWISFLQYLLLSINWRGIHIPEMTITSPCSHGGLWITRCLLEVEYSREKQSRRFLESLEGNLQTQLVREPAKERNPLDLFVEQKGTGVWCDGQRQPWVQPSGNHIHSWRWKGVSKTVPWYPQGRHCPLNAWWSAWRESPEG